MLEQAIHFKEESDALYKLLINADKNSFKLKTQFKSWTINDVLYHLHVWNIAALLSLKNENEFKEFMQNFMEAVKSPRRYVENGSQVVSFTPRKVAK